MRLALPLFAFVCGCYLSHRVEGGSDGGTDARIDGRDVGVDAPDASVPLDAGLERPFAWIPLATESERPPGRLSHLAVYDERNDRMIVFGGYDPYGELGGCCIDPYLLHRDIWALDLRTERWTRVGELPHPLMALNPVVAALDRPRNRIVVVGAVDEPNFGRVRNVAIDLTTFDTTSIPAGPWGRQWPLRATHDPVGERVIVHDAYYEVTEEAVWTLDLPRSAWTAAETEGAPTLRFHTPLTQTGSSAIMYGGFEASDDRLWRLDADFRWTALPLSGELERGRWNHRAVHEPARNSLIVYGGMFNIEHLGTYVIDLDETRGYAPVFDALGPVPPGRRDHSMILDTTRRHAVVFGGARNDAEALDDTWALQLP